MNFKYEIIEYDSYNFNKLGIFFYGEKIYPKKDFEIRSYEIKLKLIKEQISSNDFDLIIKNKKFYEKMNFIVTCNLQEFLKTENYKFEDEEDSFERFDYEKILNEFYSDMFLFHKERLIRKNSEILLDKIIYPGNEYKYGKNSEFITVDQFTSFGGNFSFENKQGCCAEIKENLFKNHINLCDISISSNYSEFDLPRNIRKRFKFDEFYQKFHKNECHLDDLFNSLKLNEQTHVTKEILKRKFYDLKYNTHFPWKLILFGNDDTSYSKFFLAKENAEKELNWLRKIQPINLKLDIFDRNYAITN